MSIAECFQPETERTEGSKVARVIRVTMNLGDLPYFESAGGMTTGTGACLRQISFHRDRLVERFPLLYCEDRLRDALEMNLFLEHRYRGRFMPPKKGGNRNPCGGVTVKTLVSLANSLSGFLTWLLQNNVDWHEIYAIAEGERTKAWLPPYRYRAYLISRILAGRLSRDTANLYINHVRQFYEWGLSTRRIDRIPFEYKRVPVRKRRKDGEFDLLFNDFRNKRALMVQTTDLVIPKKYRSKDTASDEGLTPFSTEEITLLFDSRYMQLSGRRLWAALALTCGLRADEVATLPESVADDPTLSPKRIFRAKVVGKFNKGREILIPRFLMYMLWQYRNSPERLRRAARWDLIHGSSFTRPLFLNRSGTGINTGSVCNITSCVARELRNQHVAFDRSFHDLRATFATSLASFMLKLNLPLGFIQYKLMTLLGHTQFSTTLKYLNFARSVTFESQMQSWVDRVFADLAPTLEFEAESESTLPGEED
jgi:integrase